MISLLSSFVIKFTITNVRFRKTCQVIFADELTGTRLINVTWTQFSNLLIYSGNATQSLPNDRKSYFNDIFEELKSQYIDNID